MPLFSRLFQGVPDDPFYQPRKPLWLPEDMSQPPALEEAAPAGPVRRRFALLINPFYPKSPHGSFGKHVLTPTLALTSIAGATPPGWELRYWDENLLQGPPPAGPVPEVVGITVHLTFARAGVSTGALVSRAGEQGGARRPARAILSRGGGAACRRARRWATACSFGRRSCGTSSAGRAEAALSRGLRCARTRRTRRRGATCWRAAVS